MPLLLGVLLVAAVVWVASERSAVPKVDPDANAVGPPPQFLTPDRVIFESPRSSLVVERVGEEWWIRRPVDDRASVGRIAETLRQLSLLRADRLLPSEDRARYGLTPPARRIRLERDGASWSLGIGDSAAVGSAFYALREEPPAKLFLLDRYSARRYFMADLDGLRDAVALPLDVGPVDSVHVLARGSSLRARRIDAEHWAPLSPPDVTLDPLKINRMLDRFRQPSLENFIDRPTDLAAFGLDPPRATWLVFQRGVCETLLIGHPRTDPPGIWCRPAGRSCVALLPLQFYRDMVDGWPGLADLRLLGLPPDSVVSIEYLEPVGAGSYVRSAEGWSNALTGSPVDEPAALQRDLLGLASLRRRPQSESMARATRSARFIVRDAPLVLRLASSARAETLALAPPHDSLASAWSSRWPDPGLVDAGAWRSWSYRAARSR